MSEVNQEGLGRADWNDLSGRFALIAADFGN
jgi:hypothetical protein